MALRHPECHRIHPSISNICSNGPTKFAVVKRVEQRDTYMKHGHVSIMVNFELGSGAQTMTHLCRMHHHAGRFDKCTTAYQRCALPKPSSQEVVVVF
jgi:hypothetical protein